MSSLAQALLNRSPLIWVNTAEPERVIDSIPRLCEHDKNLYIYDLFNGLMQWNHTDFSWKIVLVENQREDENGELITEEVPVKPEAWAFMYALQQENSILILRNAHKDTEDNLTLFSILFSKFRNTFWTDDLNKISAQVICLAADEDPPAELSAMVSRIRWGMPTTGELRSIITHIADRYDPKVVDEAEIDRIVTSSLGLSEFSVIETYFDSIRTHGKIDPQVVSDVRLARLKAMSSLEIDQPRVKIDDVGGLDNAKDLIKRAVWIWNNPEKAKEHRLLPLRRILLLGVSGCGKSFLCEAAADALGLQLAKAGVSKAMNRFVGQSESNIRSMFEQINALSPIAVWIDEVGRDLSGGGSSDAVDGGTTSRVHGEFLTGMQNLDEHVFLFAAANNISELPPEMLRADRFDKLMFVGFPSFSERMEIFNLHLPKGTEEDPLTYNLEELAHNTPCFTGAEIKSLIQRTAVDIVPIYNRSITTEDVLKTIPFQKNRIWIRHKSLAVHMYRSAIDDYEWASTTQHADAKIICQGREPVEATKSAIMPIVQYK